MRTRSANRVADEQDRACYFNGRCASIAPRVTWRKMLASSRSDTRATCSALRPDRDAAALPGCRLGPPRTFSGALAGTVDAPELIECLEIRRANCVTFRVLPALKCQTPRSQLPLLALGALRPTSSGSTHRQDDLAFGVAGLQVGHRLLGLREREDAVDDDFKLFGIDE